MMARLARQPRLVALSVATLLVALSVGTMAAGADDLPTPSLEVNSVDARGATLGIDVTNTGPADPKKLSVAVDGKPVDASVQSFEQAGRGSNVMVVLDNSKSVGNGAVQIAKEQLRRLAPGTNNIETLGVVTIGGGARLAVPLTTSSNSVTSSARSIAPGGAPALWDALVAAAERLDGISETNNSQIVLVSGAADSASRAKFSDVGAALRRSGAALHVITLAGGTSEVGLLNELVAVAGGSFRSGSSNDLTRMLGSVAERLGHQYRVTAPAPNSSEELVSLDIEWSGAELSAAFRPDAVTVGASALASIDGQDSLIDRLTGSSVTKWIIVALGTLSVGMFVYSIAMLITRRDDRLDFALRHYDGNTAAPGYDDFGDADDGSPMSFARKSHFFRKAVAVTNELAERQGFLAKIEDMLDQADLPLRAAEALFFYVAGAIIAAIGAALLSGDFMVLIMVVLVALLAPNFVVKFRLRRRQKKFVAQLPDMLQLLAGTLRAGYSVAQGFEAVSKEIDDPMGRELRRVMAESRLGRPIEEALDAAAERTQSEDFKWAVMAIRIQREVGGNLAELLLTVAETMTQRERLRRDVSALTAEGRMSAIVLGLLPPGLAGVMWVMNPQYIGRLTEDSFGLILLAVSVVSMGIGFAWMKKIITIEI